MTYLFREHEAIARRTSLEIDALRAQRDRYKTALRKTDGLTPEGHCVCNADRYLPHAPDCAWQEANR